MHKLQSTLGEFCEFWALIAYFWLAWVERNHFVNRKFTKLSKEISDPRNNTEVRLWNFPAQSAVMSVFRGRTRLTFLNSGKIFICSSDLAKLHYFELMSAVPYARCIWGKNFLEGADWLFDWCNNDFFPSGIWFSSCFKVHRQCQGGASRKAHRFHSAIYLTPTYGALTLLKEFLLPAAGQYHGSWDFRISIYEV